MTVTIIMKGDVESCCTFIPAEKVEDMVREWLPEGHDLTVIDLETAPWEPDTIARTAASYFAENAYPLVYIDRVLCTFGALPSKKNLLKYLSGEESFGITEGDVIAAARAMKLT